MKNKDAVNRREYPRRKAPSGAYVSTFLEENEITGFLIDLNMNGASFEYIFLDDLLPETNQINILFDRDVFHIDNIPCKFIFDIKASDQEREPVTWRRVGIQFGELSIKQKSNLEYLINHYCGYPIQLPLASSSRSTLSPVLMNSDGIFLSRLIMLVIAAKAYLKGYPFGLYRKKAISRNANKIIKQLPRQKIFRIGESHSILFKEHIMLLSKAFSKMPIKSYGKADIETSIEYVSNQLEVDKTLIQMDFLKVA